MDQVLAEFRAPWGRPLRVTTSLSLVVLLGVLVAGWLATLRTPAWRTAAVALPLIVMLAALPFTVRGYVLTESRIEVRRLGWSTFLPLAGLQAVSGEPEGLRGSVRLFGNGGLFGISGFRWSFFGVADVNVIASLSATLGFLAVCIVIVSWIFRTGYKLKN